MRTNAAATKRSASLFAALGDETRLRLLTRLSEGGALSISSLTEGSPVTRQGITKHLRVMQHAGLVRNHRHGRERLAIGTAASKTPATISTRSPPSGTTRSLASHFVEE